MYCFFIVKISYILLFVLFFKFFSNIHFRLSSFKVIFAGTSKQEIWQE